MIRKWNVTKRDLWRRFIGKNYKSTSIKFGGTWNYKKLNWQVAGRESLVFQRKRRSKFSVPSWPSWRCRGNLRMRFFGILFENLNWRSGCSVETIIRYILLQCTFLQMNTPTRSSNVVAEYFKSKRSALRLVNSLRGMTGLAALEQAVQSCKPRIGQNGRSSLNFPTKCSVSVGDQRMNPKIDMLWDLCGTGCMTISKFIPSTAMIRSLLNNFVRTKIRCKNGGENYVTSSLFTNK